MLSPYRIQRAENCMQMMGAELPGTRTMMMGRAIGGSTTPGAHRCGSPQMRRDLTWCDYPSSLRPPPSTVLLLSPVMCDCGASGAWDPAQTPAARRRNVCEAVRVRELGYSLVVSPVLWPTHAHRDF